MDVSSSRNIAHRNICTPSLDEKNGICTTNANYMNKTTQEAWAVAPQRFKQVDNRHTPKCQQGGRMLTFLFTRSLWTCESRVLMLISMVESGSSAGFAVELLAPWGLSSAILPSWNDGYTDQEPEKPQTTQMLGVTWEKGRFFARFLVPPTLQPTEPAPPGSKPHLDVSRALMQNQNDPIAPQVRAPRLQRTQNLTQEDARFGFGRPRTQRRSAGP